MTTPTGPSESHEESRAIVELLAACRAAFVEEHSSADAREQATSRVADALNQTRASDVGLDPQPELQEIEFMDIAEFAEFTVGVFLVPKGQRLPLHDHPGMTVMSKVLYGTLAITSFDKSDYSRPVQAQDYRIPIETVIRSVRRPVTCEQPCEILRPTTDGNLHEFFAAEDVAIMDVLTPPYNFGHGRPCTYFRVAGLGSAQPESPGAGGGEWPDVALGGASRGDTAWLLAVPAPKGSSARSYPICLF